MLTHEVNLDQLGIHKTVHTYCVLLKSCGCVIQFKGNNRDTLCTYMCLILPPPHFLVNKILTTYVISCGGLRPASTSLHCLLMLSRVVGNWVIWPEVDKCWSDERMESYADGNWWRPLSLLRLLPLRLISMASPTPLLNQLSSLSSTLTPLMSRLLFWIYFIQDLNYTWVCMLIFLSPSCS